MNAVRLQPEREKSLLRRHPWVYSGSIARIRGEPQDGETVEVVGSDGKFLGWGAYSSKSNIKVRIWSWIEDQAIDQDFFRERLIHAIHRHEIFPLEKVTNAWRLVHGESDSLPGLIIDRYDKTLVIQFLSCGPERWRDDILSILVDITHVERIFERSDVDVRRLEGLPERKGLLYGSPLSGLIDIVENELAFSVDVENGHKTGFYLDQRKNRKVIRELAGNRDILDCFSYTGGFAINAAKGMAKSVLAVDSSADALQIGTINQANNNLPVKIDWLEGDIFNVLRKFRVHGRNFDMIILDPPKFAPTIAQVERATRGYKDINMLAFKLLRPGGILATFSCSSGIDAGLFQKIVAGAAVDAGVNPQIIFYLQQDSDHPVALNFPEGAYLKGLIVNI